MEAFHFLLMVPHSKVMQLKFHYYRLILLLINIDENRSNHNNYECMKAIRESVRYSPQRFWITQQILVTSQILKFVNKISNTPHFKICQQILVTPFILKYVNKY